MTAKLVRIYFVIILAVLPYHYHTITKNDMLPQPLTTPI